MSSGGAGDRVRVSIPVNVRKTIQNIKEITGNHTDEEIYAMLKECSMDPNETTQKLLALDPFLEVRRKRDKKKENVNNKDAGDSRWRSGTQGRGSRGGRMNFYPRYSSHDGGNGRASAPGRESSSSQPTEKGVASSVPTSQEKIKETAAPESTVAVVANGPIAVASGTTGEPAGSITADKTLVVAHGTADTLGEPVPNSNSSSVSVNAVSSSTVCFSSSDPVLVPSNDSRVAGTVGTIKCEVLSHRVLADTDAGSNPEKPAGATKEWIPKPTNPNVAQVSTATSLPEVPSVAVKTIPQSQLVSEGDKDAPASKLNKLKELNLPQRQHVIIPNHIHVPESERTKLSFGSFDTSFGVAKSYASGQESEKSSATQSVEEVSEEPTASDSEDTVAVAEEGAYPDQPHSPSPVPGTLQSDGDVSVSAAPDYSEGKQENVVSASHPYPGVHSSPSYFGIVHPVLGGQIAQFENSESQPRDASRMPSFVGTNSLVLSTAGPTALATQAAGLMQSSIPATQQPLPVFRPPYPPNYIPYGHYFSPFYPPPGIHQFLSNGAFPQQPQAGNIFPAPPAAAAAAGVKFSVPQFKAGTNSTHMGMPSGYGPYASSPAGYNPSSAGAGVNSTTNEDLSASQLKENNVYLSGQQSEGSAVWITAPGRDISTMPASSFYNLPPQGQHVAFAPQQAGHGPFAGIYHPAQAVSAAGVHQLLQQSQAMGGGVDMAGGPAGSVYQQQPQHQQVNWPSNF
ncbi:GBF-interacting protein 1 [Linum grandiflorum]